MSKYTPNSRAATAITKVITVTMAVGVLVVPCFMLLWVPMNRVWRAGIVSISMLAFATLMSCMMKSSTNVVFVGTATYCAVLATCLGASS